MQRWLFVSVFTAGAMVVTGCATKNFVREEFRGRDAEIGRVDTDLGQERARVNDLSTQVGDVRLRTDDARQRADRAGTLGTQALARADEAIGKAGEAMAKADDTDKRFSRVWANRNKLNVSETFVVRFGFNKSTLDDRAQTELLTAVKLLKEDGNVVVTLAGYTDPAGQADYNLQLSERRAAAVRRFLVQQGVDLHRIQSIGLGEAREPKGRRAENRRVVVQLMVPGE